MSLNKFQEAFNLRAAESKKKKKKKRASIKNIYFSFLSFFLFLFFFLKKKYKIDKQQLLQSKTTAEKGLAVAFGKSKN